MAWNSIFKKNDGGGEELAPVEGQPEKGSLASSEKPKRKRGKKPRFRGVLDQADNLNRWLLFGFIALLCLTTIFTQLGIASFVIPFVDLDVYLFLALAPIAITAALLGTREAFLIGLLSGAALYLHASIMPLDVYELEYVWAYTIIVMALTGSLLGWLFKRALRNNPTGTRRIVYLAIACLVASLFFTCFFAIGAVFKAFTDTFFRGLVVSFGDMTTATASDAELTQVFRDYFSAELANLIGEKAVARLGSVQLQWLLDAALMLVAVVCSDEVARFITAKKNEMGIRPLFSMRLFLVVLASFSIVSALSFVSITIGSRERALEAITEDLDYLCAQLARYDEQSLAFVWFSKRVGVELDSMDTSSFTDDEKEFYATLVNSSDILGAGKVLSGYDVERNGLAMVTLDDYLLECNDERIEVSTDLNALSNVKDFFSDDVIVAISMSLLKDEPQRIVYGDAIIVTDENGVPLTRGNEIAYLQSKDINGLTVTIIQPSSLVFARRATTMQWTRFMSSLLLLEVFALTVGLLSRVVIEPVRKINDTLNSITAGDLQARVEVAGTSEFMELSEGINQTVDALNGWIAEAESRMDAELAAAKAIQESALPRTFPPFPDIPHFDLYATMNPAREVGGDFYDFFLVGDDCTTDEGRIAFVMADVSGKGVPASLFMMKAKTQLRDDLTHGMELGEAVAHANDQLCDGNDAGMFVTAWIGILDYGTGHIEYVNAGHNPPLFCDRDSGWTWIKEKSGLPLGLYEGLPYRVHSLDCHAGDQLLLYTDGVTEAMDVEDKLYGEDRLEAVAKNNDKLPARGLVDVVRRDVAAFADGAEQADDITIMTLDVGSPADVTATVFVRASLDELSNVHEFVHAELDRLQCPDKAREQLDIAVEELFVNVCSYAYPDATADDPGDALLHCTLTVDPPSITIDIVDEGVPFDPLAKPDAVTPKEIEKVPIGGLGILMSKRSVDEMRYKRVGESNIVTIVKRW